MRSRAMFLAAAALIPGFVLAGPALAVGASPGVVMGGDGASWQGHPQRFVAVPGGIGTVIRELRAPGQGALRSQAVSGSMGIPVVAYDGSVEQVPATSANVVLAARTAAAFPHRSRFVVVSTRDLHVVRRITLRGAFAFDALSPDGATVYLIQHTSAQQITHYKVRAYDVRSGRLLAGVIADKTSGEWRMDGVPATRLETADGGRAYTLYQGGSNGAFVHALDTRSKTARCIDLPGMGNRDVMAMRLSLAGGGTRLVIRAGTRPVAAIDTRTLAIVRATEPARRQASPSTPSSSHTTAIAVVAVLILLAGGAGAVRLFARLQQNPAHDGRS